MPSAPERPRPAGTPELSVVAPLYNESQNVRPLVEWILQALESTRLAENTIDASPITPEEFAAFIRAEVDKWTAVIRDANIPKQ